MEIVYSALVGIAGAVLWLARTLAEHGTKIEAFERFHDILVKRMVDATISPHTPILDDILRKMREGEALTDDERRFALEECDKEFWVAKRAGLIGRSSALAVIIAQLESYKP